MNPNYDIYEKRSKKNRESNRSIEPIESERRTNSFPIYILKKMLNYQIHESKRRHIRKTIEEKS